MAPPRIFIPGLSHHVRHRGNNGCDVFRDDDDRQTFLSMLRKAAAENGVAVHGYALMTTHFHAQVTGFDANSIPRALQSLGRRYVRYFNRRYGRTGTLWEGRYRSSLICDEHYWFTCLRYVELNPVRAGMVKTAADYAWSSFRANGLGREDPLLTPHELYLRLADGPRARAAVWAQMCGQPLSEAEMARIREAIRRGEQLGEEGPALKLPEAV